MKRKILFVTLLCAAALLFPVSAQGSNTTAVTAIDGTEVFLARQGAEPRKIKSEAGSLRTNVSPLSTLYFSIANAARAEDLTGMRVVTSWSKGEELTGPPTIEYRKVFDQSGKTALGYRYVVALPILQTTDDKPHTLRGTIRLTSRLNARVPTVSFMLSVRPDGEEISEEAIYCQSPLLETDFGRFEDAISIYFYDNARFDVDVSGQGPLDLGCSNRVVTDIAERYRKAKLQYLTWSKQPFFNRAGKLFIEAAPDSFLYEMQGERLVDRTQSYSAEVQAFVLTTRRLEGFVISDRALNPDAAAQPEKNPLTGVGRIC